jgi:hypothetical protein
VRRPHLVLLGLLLSGGAAAACTGPAPETDRRYGPTERVLETVAVLEKAVRDDTYRYRPARDITGKNIYRASFERLERLEDAFGDKLRSGYMLDVFLFAKARALERIGEYDLAAKSYLRVGELNTPLQEAAGRGRGFCERFLAARQLQPEPLDTPDAALAVFGRRTSQLEKLLEEAGDSHYAYIAREELEQTDIARARYFAARRLLDPRLDALSLQQYQRLVENHAASKNRLRNLVALGDMYCTLARDYSARVPSQSLAFDPATFDEYAFGCTRVLESVSQQDGEVEKVEATRKLEAFIAFQLQVYDERLPR